MVCCTLVPHALVSAKFSPVILISSIHWFCTWASWPTFQDLQISSLANFSTLLTHFDVSACRGLPTEEIHLSHQFYSHIFTSLGLQVPKVSCKSGLRQRILTWATTSNDGDPQERLGSSCQKSCLTSACSQSSLWPCGNKSVWVFFFSFFVGKFTW